MKPASWRWRLFTALALLAALWAALPSQGLRRLRGTLPAIRDKVAVVPVFGPIFDPSPVVHLLHRYRREVEGLRAVVLALDTPGGDVASAQEICGAIEALQEDGVKVVAALGSVAASGGYYVASPCDLIVANPGTLTGSIGVLMETFHADRALDKVGLKFETIKSGEFKDAGSFTRPLSARERDLFQGVIDDVYEQFLGRVLEERKGPLTRALARRRRSPEEEVSEEQLRAYVRSFADGRVFSGRKALEYGLVDELGGLDEAIAAAAELAGVEDPEVVTYRPPRGFAEWITGMSRREIAAWLGGIGGRSWRFGYYAW